MRSRYSAFAVSDSAYLLATWHPGTRPRELTLDRAQVWTGLTIDSARGGLLDVSGEVAFQASYRLHGRPGVLAERSRFVREAGRWLYVDGVDAVIP